MADVAALASELDCVLKSQKVEAKQRAFEITAHLIQLKADGWQRLLMNQARLALDLMDARAVMTYVHQYIHHVLKQQPPPWPNAATEASREIAVVAANIIRQRRGIGVTHGAEGRQLQNAAVEWMNLAFSAAGEDPNVIYCMAILRLVTGHQLVAADMLAQLVNALPPYGADDARNSLEQLRAVALCEGGNPAAAVDIARALVARQNPPTAAAASALTCALALVAPGDPQALHMRRQMCKLGVAEREQARGGRRTFVAGWGGAAVEVDAGLGHTVWQLHNVYMEGRTPYIYDADHVYGGARTFVSDITEYIGDATTTIHITTPVMLFTVTNPNNYYHVLIESAGRLAAARTWWQRQQHTDTPIRILLFADAPPFVRDILHLLGVETSMMQEITPHANQRWLFSQLFVADVPLVFSVPNYPDVWDLYVPSPPALARLRAILGPTRDHPRCNQGSVVYITRNSSPRRVTGATEALLVALRETAAAAGATLEIATGRGAVSAQADMFRNARVVLGPHGAGLANIVFAPTTTTVLEFTMSPNVNNTYGHLARAFGQQYVLLSQPACGYHGDYVITHEDIASITTAVRAALTCS
jgi:capsular polysaccharide biosynthesis protein